MDVAAIEELIEMVEADTGVSGNCADEPDEDCVGWDGDNNPLIMTFGHVRQARAELEALKAKS